MQDCSVFPSCVPGWTFTGSTMFPVVPGVDYKITMQSQTVRLKVSVLLKTRADDGVDVNQYQH